MRELEVIEGKITRAQQVLDHIESPDFSQKKFLRVDQDVSDRAQAAQFLQNYARVGLIKERLLRLSLPRFQVELESELLVSTVPVKHKLVFLEGNKVELDGQKIEMGKKEFIVLSALARHINEQVLSRDLSQEVLNNPDPQETGLRRTIWHIRRRLNKPEIFDSKLASIHSWFKLQNVEVVWPEGEVTLEEEEGQTDTTPVIPIDTAEWRDIPYEPTEEEERSEEETRVLDKVISIMLGDPHSKIRFDVLQKELYTPKRSRIKSGTLFCQIYLASDLKLLFSSAFNKIREEALVEFLSSKWTEQEKNIYDNILVLKTRMRTTDDVEFVRRITEEFTRSQRQFYRDNSPQAGVPLSWVEVPKEWRQK